MCKIGLGVTFRVGNRRKPLKSFEQVKSFLFVCLFSALCVLLKSKGEQHTPTTKIIASGFSMMVVIIIIR